MNIEEVITEAKRLRDEGWSVLACEDPCIGAVGAVAWRDVLEDRYGVSEENRDLYHYPLGELKCIPHVLETAREYHDLLSQEGSYSCDSPKTLSVGVIRYDREKKESNWYTLSLRKYKDTCSNATEEEREAIKSSTGRQGPSGEPFAAERAMIRKGLAS